MSAASSVLVLCADPGIPLYGPSGASAHLRGVIRAFDRLGWTVHSAVSRLEDRRGRVPDEVPGAVTVVPPRRWGWIPRRWRERGERWDGARLVRAAMTRQPDLVYERHSLFCDPVVDAPHIVELNAPLAVERAMFEHLYDAAFAERVERRSLRSADRVVAVSAHLVRWAVAAVGCAPERVRHVPNGVDDRGPGDRDRVRHALGLDGLVIGFVGSLKPWHGVDRIPALLDALPEATALVVGEGRVPIPHHPRIVSTGRVAPADVGHHVAAMDVGLAPYPLEAPPWYCPLKLLEYRAQGVPSVATDLGDCARFADTVLDTEEPEAWASAIRALASTRREPQVRSWRQVVTEALEGLRDRDPRSATP